MSDVAPECHVELDCPGPTYVNALVKVNGKVLPLVGIQIEIRYGKWNRVVLEVEPTEVGLVIDAVPGLRLVEVEERDDEYVGTLVDVTDAQVRDEVAAKLKG